MNKAIKYRIYPTTEQAVLLNKTFGCCRKVYNLMLEERIRTYKDTGKAVKDSPAKYKKEYPYLKEPDSLALANEWSVLNTAFANFHRDKNIGFPRYKSARRDRKSYTTFNQNGTIAIIDDRYIKLPKVKNIRAKIHRKFPKGYVIKSATVSKDPDGKYYVSVLFEYSKTIIPRAVDGSKVIGLDYASDGLYKDNFGNKGTNHKYYRESHDKLAKEQRRLSRKVGNKKGSIKSQNYLKQLHKVNKIHKHISNQRLDNLHKLSTQIANAYDVVCVESLNMKSMSNKGFGNGRATMDNGYGMFLNMLEYKLSDRGKYFVKVDKYYPSSQICHNCGTIHKKMKDLSIRTMRCACGFTCDRDVNAALNIRDEGMRVFKEQYALSG